MGNQLLTAKDVAERLQVNLRTAHRIIHSIPHVNVGNGKKNELLRVTEEMLERYIEERTVLPFQPGISRRKPLTPCRIGSGNGKIARRK